MTCVLLTSEQGRERTTVPNEFCPVGSSSDVTLTSRKSSSTLHCLPCLGEALLGSCEVDPKPSAAFARLAPFFIPFSNICAQLQAAATLNSLAAAAQRASDCYAHAEDTSFLRLICAATRTRTVHVVSESLDFAKKEKIRARQYFLASDHLADNSSFKTSSQLPAASCCLLIQWH